MTTGRMTQEVSRTGCWLAMGEPWAQGASYIIGTLFSRDVTFGSVFRGALRASRMTEARVMSVARPNFWGLGVLWPRSCAPGALPPCPAAGVRLEFWGRESSSWKHLVSHVYPQQWFGPRVSALEAPRLESGSRVAYCHSGRCCNSELLSSETGPPWY